MIVGVGARSPSGLTALQVAMSARARKFVPRESHLIDRHGERIATARLRSIADNVIGFDRFAALAGPALVQAASPWTSQRARRADVRLPVIVALPSDARPGFDPRLRRDLLRTLESRAGIALDHARSELICQCRGGGIAAFERALARLHRGEDEAIAVGGIDSYFDPDALEHLDAELRLHGLDTENGIVPGEGAAFLVLTTRARTGSLPRHGRLLAAATEDEPRPWGSEEPSLGSGITLAVRRALEAAELGPRAVAWVLTDVANERHRVDEWSYAFARNHAAFTSDVVHDQPLLKVGDVGAASAALLGAIALVRWQTRSAVGPAALIAAHSDGPERGAMVLSGGEVP
ncbi:hypothetical protein WMF38_07630 [Sorangium sp. So ce118]